MKRTTIYRIRRSDTGQFYMGGAYCSWNENGKSYEKIGAAKCGWSHCKRNYWGALPAGVTACIVEFTVTEAAGKTEDLS